jgi:hypothetical protein
VGRTKGDLTISSGMLDGWKKGWGRKKEGRFRLVTKEGIDRNCSLRSMQAIATSLGARLSQSKPECCDPCAVVEPRCRGEADGVGPKERSHCIMMARGPWTP